MLTAFDFYYILLPLLSQFLLNNNIIYAVLFFLSKWFFKKVESLVYNTKHHGSQLSRSQIKEIVDNFDHIACDNNLIAKGFIRSYKNETDADLREFDFYELYYYIDVATKNTQLVVSNSEACINTLSKTTVVDLHRIYNQLDMLDSAKDFMLDHIADKELDAHDNLKLVLISQIITLGKILTEIRKKCDKFREQNFSDAQVEKLKKEFSSYLKRDDT